MDAEAWFDTYADARAAFLELASAKAARLLRSHVPDGVACLHGETLAMDVTISARPRREGPWSSCAARTVWKARLDRRSSGASSPAAGAFPRM